VGKKHPRDQPPDVLIGKNVRFNERLHRQLKAEAALRGKTIEDLIHELVCRSLGKADLIDRPPSSLRRERAAL